MTEAEPGKIFLISLVFIDPVISIILSMQNEDTFIVKWLNNDTFSPPKQGHKAKLVGRTSNNILGERVQHWRKLSCLFSSTITSELSLIIQTYFLKFPKHY
jgi:hypothetical protein